ncbi:MAG TPA: amidohydrolase family protein [Solirubrobacteraceae bacterium]|nr:amidohydrolase family protein [Solirubrobacteraceae bacterium]
MIPGKIAVEEHWTSPDYVRYMPAIGLRSKVQDGAVQALQDLSGRLEEMDRHGIAVAVLMLNSHGIQGEPDRDRAVAGARQANDLLGEAISAHPDRFVALAAVAMQAPQAAAEELERAVRELRFRGACVNGFCDVGDHETGRYYEERAFDPFWERLQELGVPLYLHPRSPLPRNLGLYEGHLELVGPTWAWGVETATHALRLITGGVFDRFPGVNVVLGHLGETLPFAVDRMEKRLTYMSDLGLERPVGAYFRENFYVSTSGNFHTQSLLGSIAELGAERVLFAVDYPFEQMATASDWFDAVPLAPADREKIARTNAARLFAIDSG